MRDLRATVAQPGALETPLLGQSVLNRLQGYHVQGDRMILHRTLSLPCRRGA